MFEINEKVMHYKFGLSEIISIEYNQDYLEDCYKIKDLNSDNIDYFPLKPAKKALPKIRKIISNTELDNLISKINMVSDKLIKTKKDREKIYGELVQYGNTSDLVAIIKRYDYLLKTYYPDYISKREYEIYDEAKRKLFSEVAFVKKIDVKEAEELLFGKKEEKKADPDFDLFF